MEEKSSAAKCLRFLWPRIVRFRGHYRVALVCMAGATIADLAFPYVAKLLVDLIQSSSQEDDIVRGVLRLAAVSLAVIIARYVLTHRYLETVQAVGVKIIHRLREELFARVMVLPVSFFDAQPVGQITARLTADVNNLQELFTTVVITVAKDLILLGGALVLLAVLSPTLCGVIFAGLFIVVLATASFGRVARGAYRRTAALVGTQAGAFTETVSGFATVKVLCAESALRGRLASLAGAELEAGLLQVRAFGVFHPVVAFVGYGVTAVLLYLGGRAVLAGSLPLGTLVAAIAYSELCFAPVRDLSEKYNLLQQGLVACERCLALMGLEAEMEIVPNHGVPACACTIEFRNVWFAYSGDEWVLRDFSLVCAPGTVTAIVGPTGSGKTTVMQLLLRFYRPQRGEILYNGRPISEMPLALWRAHIAFMSQDVFAAYSDLDREKSAQASVGQLQQALLAKVLNQRSPVLILDEATAHLDSVVEAEIKEQIHHRGPDRVTLAVAHRLSTIREADQIVVLRQGQIEERGTHESLCASEGLYHAMASLEAA